MLRVARWVPPTVFERYVLQDLAEGFIYDAVGNRQTGPSNPREAASFTYQYDYEHRLTQAVKVSSAGTDTVTFKYDPFGRRIEKSVATTEDGLPTTYKYTYVYDNEDIILEALERTQDGVTTTAATTYVHGPGVDEPLSLTREGQTYYYHADGLGSITAVTDANGAVVNRYAYDSFGRVQRAETVRNAYAFTGREYDSETGLYYLRARYYDPEAGRFVSKDPIGFAGGDVNLYNYTSGNPVNWVDPWGLKYGDLWDPRTYVDDAVGYWGGFFGGINDFYRNYRNMREANWRAQGTDKYFHCRANCEAAQRGPGGQDAACVISEAREWSDQKIKGDSASSSEEDRAANQYGRSQGNINRGVSCAQICAPYRPSTLPPQY